ncbi:tripartite tricarboxylate transporter substrate binding protein [Polaromonas sp. AER18D-145]|uniref:Bug family tripartite tricarboxylate transporter substrate binding protein n=1 Tax=Polaromonas sp. AER18D-145 TaxID=1977060 RepID=UPI000BBC24FA|nr:tripartite tricarboxylate transporter substrate-binding protein [Polaromonas sp. AER18D-145]
MQTNRREFMALSAGALMLGLPGAARAQQLDKPVRIIVAYAAGGASDTIARYVAEKITQKVGHPVIVENRPGADGNIAAEAVARASADNSYTLLVSGVSTHAANASIYKKLPFDPERDFTPMTTLMSSPYLMVINPQRVKVTTLREFVASAKAESKDLSFASANVGGRVAGERFRALAQIQAVNVPYKSSPQAMTDLLGGQFDFYFCDTVTALPQIQAGKIVALGVSVRNRMSMLPNVPAIAESGYPDFDVSSWISMWSAASVPVDVSNRLAEWVNSALDNPQGRDFITSKGQLPFPGSPSQLRALQRRDTVEWGNIIRSAGMQQP